MAGDDFRQRRTNITQQPARILVVDEDPGDLRILRITLEAQGLEVFASTSYEAGMEFLEKGTAEFVVVSQGTRAFEGRRILERSMQLNRGCPVLVVARSIDMPCYLDAMQLGAIDYMEKPISSTELVRFVRAHVAHGRMEKPTARHHAVAIGA